MQSQLSPLVSYTLWPHCRKLGHKTCFPCMTHIYADLMHNSSHDQTNATSIDFAGCIFTVLYAWITCAWMEKIIYNCLKLQDGAEWLFQLIVNMSRLLLYMTIIIKLTSWSIQFQRNRKIPYIYLVTDVLHSRTEYL